MQKHINNYHLQRDKVTAFTSALLKYYYLPEMLGIKPSQINIAINRYGKPYLPSHPEVDFSISHSGEYVALAVTFGKRIGIDIELIDENIELSSASIVFSKSECNLVKNYADFFTIWTKKEAYLKCIRVGFLNQLYMDTEFNTDLLEHSDNHIIKTFRYKNYMMSVCLSSQTISELLGD